MNKKDYDFPVFFSEEIPKEQKELMEHLCKEHAKEKTSIYVCYEPECGCNYVRTVLLDRFPMSEKIIIGKCKDCEKGSRVKICDPLIFYIPLLKEFFSEEEFETLVVQDSYQAQFIEAYKQLFREEERCIKKLRLKKPELFREEKNDTQ